jgi:hypothetical protein
VAPVQVKKMLNKMPPGMQQKDYSYFLSNSDRKANNETTKRQIAKGVS